MKTIDYTDHNTERPAVVVAAQISHLTKLGPYDVTAEKDPTVIHLIGGTELIMKRLTLEEAIGQTLRAKIEVGEELLLRFDEGFVTLKTSYESYDITDYTDHEDPLARPLRFCDETLDELLAGGFIDAEQKAAAVADREEQKAKYEQQRAENERRQYEQLRAKYEPK